MQKLTSTNKHPLDITDKPHICGRPGLSPEELGISGTGQSCPDVLTLSNDHYLVIGTDVTDDYRYQLPADTGCSTHERIVMVRHETMHSFAQSITKVRQ